jgi:hypothetical protein
LIIAVPLEASLPTLVSQTISICASQAELEMNIGFTGCAPAVGLQYCRRAASERRWRQGLNRKALLPARWRRLCPRVAFSGAPCLKAVVANTSCPQ